MPTSITVTKRELKDKHSGIDISVSSHEKAASAKQVRYYQVVVITNLPFYKRPEHGEDDTVQFMVQRDYEAFEKLQREITQQFPELRLPALPRKFHLFVDFNDIEERQMAFDCLLKVIAKDKAMAVSVPMLQFLGFDLLADKKYYKERRELLQKQEETREKEEKSLTSDNDQLFGEEEKTEDSIFADIPQTKATSSAYVGGSIFEETSSKASAKVAMLDSDILFLDTDTKIDSNHLVPTTGDYENDSKILNVSQSLDDVLQIANKPKQKPSATKMLPGKSSSGSGSGLFDDNDTKQTEDITSMGTDDIMKYIEQNQVANDDLNLF